MSVGGQVVITKCLDAVHGAVQGVDTNDLDQLFNISANTKLMNPFLQWI